MELSASVNVHRVGGIELGPINDNGPNGFARDIIVKATQPNEHSDFELTLYADSREALEIRS